MKLRVECFIDKEMIMIFLLKYLLTTNKEDISKRNFIKKIKSDLSLYGCDYYSQFEDTVFNDYITDKDRDSRILCEKYYRKWNLG